MNLPERVESSPRPLRVIVADDSKFLCRLLARYLQTQPGIEVVGTALEGTRALKLVQQLRPDVLTLDIDMPGMSGLDVLGEIMRSVPTPVVIVSGISQHAAEITCQAIEQGAVDFLLKYQPGVEIDPESLRKEFISKVRFASRVKVVRSIRIPGQCTAGPNTSELIYNSKRDLKNRLFLRKSAGIISGRNQPHSNNSHGHHNSSVCPIVVIGASTGGPTALRQLLERLPKGFPGAVVVVQHLPSPFSKVLVVQLNRQISLPVEEAIDGDYLLPGRVLVAPCDKHLTLDSRGCVRLTDGPKVCGHRPSIDVAMQSIGEFWGTSMIGVILTGMGNDGAEGLAYIHTRGGQTYVQSPDTCVVNGMPLSAIELGAAEHMGTPAEIGIMITATVTKEVSVSRLPDN